MSATGDQRRLGELRRVVGGIADQQRCFTAGLHEDA